MAALDDFRRRNSAEGRLRPGPAASKAFDLAALPEEVRHTPMFSLGLHTYAVTLSRCLLKSCKAVAALACQSMSAMQACSAGHSVCDSLRLPARQVLAIVVSKLPTCKVVELQHVSRWAAHHVLFSCITPCTCQLIWKMHLT